LLHYTHHHLHLHSFPTRRSSDLPIKLTSICLVASSGIGNIFLNMIGTKTHVMTALKIKIPDISDDIVPSFSAIFAEAMTKDKVDVNRNAEDIVVFISNHRRT